MFQLFTALKNKSFLALWSAELFSQIAMNMMNFLLILFAYHLTNSNTAVSGIVLSFTLPALFFGIIAGVYVDRWNKKKVLIATNFIRAGLLTILLLFHSSLIVLYIATFLISIVTQFFIPAESPMIPLVVDKDQLFSANALFSFAWFGSVFIAYALSGPLLLLLGRTSSLLFLVAFFVLGGLAAMFVRVHHEDAARKKPKVKVRFITEAFDAIKTIWNKGDVGHAFFLLALTQVLTLIVAVLGPGFARDVLRIPVDAFPLVFITPAIIGMLVGGAFSTNVLYRFSRHKSANLGIFLAAIAIFAMAKGREISNIIWSFHIFPYPHHAILLGVMVSVAIVLGIANAFMFVPSNTLIQEQTEEAERGKIYGTLNSVVALLSFLPVVLVGPFADAFGVTTVLVGISICIAVLGISRIKL